MPLECTHTLLHMAVVCMAMRRVIYYYQLVNYISYVTDVRNTEKKCSMQLFNQL